MSCLDTARVMGHSLDPVPPASTIPFTRAGYGSSNALGSGCQRSDCAASGECLPVATALAGGDSACRWRRRLPGATQVSSVPVLGVVPAVATTPPPRPANASPAYPDEPLYLRRQLAVCSRNLSMAGGRGS